ncbi:ABC transporter permease [Allomuricauda sp. F6463D]|uniref:ABC transporter permease n=1 Tax=Allomuricauda sp. F6463D TaxID=2926409 RepID=UPI001FF19E35|nr:ABC transporter permease [Muricauda sp. F6463D]MCK0159134.1 ABC transporter permease [Muricauda sp. F6463D]
MNMKVIWKLIKKEALLVFNDKSILLVLFVAPFLYLFLIGTTYIQKDEEKVSVGVVDMDRTKSSRMFLNKLNATQKVDLNYTYNNLPEAKNGLYSFDVQGYVYIPHDFEKKLKTKESSPIGLVLDNTRFLPSNDINKSVNMVALDYAVKSRENFFKSKMVSPKLARNNADPVTIQVNAVYNPNNNYGDFLLPFILFLILHQTLLIGLSESVASDREKNLMRIGFRESKNSFIDYILGKTGIYFLIFLAYTLFVLLVAFPLFDLPLHGSLFALLGASVIFLLATVLYGWFFASFFSTETGAMEVMAFTSYPVFLITGVTWSIHEMPLFVQFLSNLIPLRPFFVFLKKLSIMGIDSHLYLNEIIHLLILLIIGYVSAYFRFRYLQKRKPKIKSAAGLRTSSQ